MDKYQNYIAFHVTDICLKFRQIWVTSNANKNSNCDFFAEIPLQIYYR